MKNDFLERLIERLEQLDPTSVQGYMLKLARQKGTLDTIFNAIKEGIIVLDQEMRVEYINQASRDLLGLPMHIEGQEIYRYLKELDWQSLRRQDLQGWESLSRQEIEVFYPRHRFLTFYFVPTLTDDGEFDKIVLILHDNTEMREAVEFEKESEKIEALTMLAAGVAHEIGNPLNSLNIHLQLLKRMSPHMGEVTDDVNEMLEICTSEVERMKMIVDQFLGAVRSQKPEMLPQDIGEILRASLDFMKGEIEERDIQIEALWHDPLPMVKGDLTQLKQAFYNLIKNAVQAMPHGGDLKILCDDDGDFLRIAFADTGGGMNQQTLAKMFDAYHTDRIGGTGLGLFIVERVIREHGGRIGVSSKEGKGTIFTIFLPLRERKVRLLESKPLSSE